MTSNSPAVSLRQCLGRFATGITVVTCSDDAGRPCGITANSFSSVSLEPPLVLWNIAKSSNSLAAFLNARHFAFHVLSDGQEALSQHFARTDHTRFDGIDYAMSSEGVPILPDCIAVMRCSTFETHDCGDHHIIIGHVERFDVGDGEPLLFYRSRYRTLAEG
jgi:3-hydroxy-9,10-secoandrosta-1,3,5(10)-triene-9,17-dione monooxygenase reductase component